MLGVLSSFPFITFLLLFAPYRTHAAGPQNITIDDVYGDGLTGKKLTYDPPEEWTRGDTCSQCIIHLDTSRVWRGTWEDTTQHPGDPQMKSITAHFSGTGVYVFNALAAYLYGPDLKNTTVTYLTFEIDGAHVGDFFSQPGADIQYGVPVYANHSLPDGPHTLVVRVAPGPDGKQFSFVLFDYIVYTTTDADIASLNSTSTSTSTSTSPSNSPAPTNSPDSSPTGSKQVPVGAVVGGVVGGVAALLLLGGLLWVVRRRAARTRGLEYGITPAMWSPAGPTESSGYAAGPGTRERAPLWSASAPGSTGAPSTHSPSNTTASDQPWPSSTLMPATPYALGAAAQSLGGVAERRSPTATESTDHAARQDFLEQQMARMQALERRLQLVEAPPQYDAAVEAVVPPPNPPSPPVDHSSHKS